MKKLLVSLGALVLVLALGLALAIAYLRSARPDYNENVRASRVRTTVEVLRDSAGVPHVWAGSEEDMLFAQGYLHAQDRLWQMELFRRVAEGRLSEVMGESMIDSDRFLRTLGLWRAAARNEAVLNADHRRLLEAYAAGVNHFVASHDGPLPPEFIALRIKPEPWTPRHSLAIEKVMSWDLTVYEGTVSLTRAARRLGEAKARYLAPADPAWGATILEIPEAPQIPRAAAILLDALRVTRASNAWVIGGTRSKSGKPILANDMHLMLRQPGVWYLMALHAPNFDVAGMTLPGVPNVIAGHNRAVAWGFTNAMLDDVDLFIERVAPHDSTRYLTPAGSAPFTFVAETLRVKGRSDPIIFHVRSTRHGPVISDVEDRLRGQDVIALQWVAFDTSHSLRAFPAFNRARNADELLAAVPDFDNPHQNVVYADTFGRFGYVMAGRVPMRGERKRAPRLPVPGWTGEWDWHGYLPHNEHPRVREPSTGYVVTANNRQVRGELGDLIGSDWDLPFRAMRIREMIRASATHDAASVHRMQLDVKDLLALRYGGHAAQAARRAGLTEIAALLDDWDGVANRDSRAAPYFYAWYEKLRRNLGTTLFGSPTALPREVLNTALDSGAVLWLGLAGRTRLDSLASVSMREAQQLMDGSTWGDLHNVEIVHVLARAAAVERLLDLNVGPAPHGGSPTTVNVAQYTGNEFPITTSYGPSQRHVVDMADVDGSGGFILPSGQSGIPGSRHYADMFERWRNGGLWRIPLERRAAEARAVHRMLIEPESK